MATKTKAKSQKVQRKIEESLDILSQLGIPFETLTTRQSQVIAMAFLALLDVKQNWKDAKSLEDGYGLSSKELIKYCNTYFEENISLGTYDAVPKTYLKLLILADLVRKSGLNPSENPNSKNRKYAIPANVRDLVIYYGTRNWDKRVSSFNGNKTLLRDQLRQVRKLDLLPVRFADTNTEEYFHNSPHNQLQKEIVEKFLALFGGKCEILYVGDALDKSKRNNTEALKQINFFDIAHGILPDVVAYNKEKNLLFLIEAYHSTGPINKVRRIELQKNLLECTAELIFVTAFAKMSDFKKEAVNIAWETEVWIAEEPHHLIHFNGHKFLGGNK